MVVVFLLMSLPRVAYPVLKLFIQFYTLVVSSVKVAVIRFLVVYTVLVPQLLTLYPNGVKSPLIKMAVSITSSSKTVAALSIT